MRRRIRLTGRRQLSRSSISVKVITLPHKRLLAFSVADPNAFRVFPRDAKIKLRLVENKIAEVIDFGTIADQKNAAEIKNASFSAPSCQLRIASTASERQGLLLGSTDTWTLQIENDTEGDRSKKGILNFQPMKTAPRSWKLDIRDDDYPVVYVDDRIPDPRSWARTDPVFVSCVLPGIISKVFDDIFEQDSPADIPWMLDWIRWGEMLMPGRELPKDSAQDKKDWVEHLVDTFCLRHYVADKLLTKLIADGAVP